MTILIADSTMGVRETYHEFLPGYSLRFSGDGPDAVRQLRRSRDAVDHISLVVLLWQLPGASTVLAYLREELAEMPLIAIDAAGNSAAIAAARRHGAVDVIPMPLLGERLQEAVRRASGEARLTPLLRQLQQRLVGQDRLWKIALLNLARVIPFSIEPVLITGESGVGKELAARAVHELGPRSESRFLVANVTKMQRTWLESALFGHKRGAFAGAGAAHVGWVQECGDGTLFLDEIGELPDDLQTKLLRVGFERMFRPIGGSKDLPFKGRLIFATNKDLKREVEEKRFLADLYRCINSKEIRLPALRERRNDWLLVMQHFLDRHAPGSELKLAAETRAILSDYSFPGNARQLEDFVKHALTHQPVREICPHHLPPRILADTSVVVSSPSPQRPEEWKPHIDKKADRGGMRANSHEEVQQQANIETQGVATVKSYSSSKVIHGRTQDSAPSVPQSQMKSKVLTVFISHASKERAIAEQVDAALQGLEIRTWLSERDILPSQHWDEAIVEGINGAWLLLLLYSESAGRSQYVRREIRLASERKLVVLTVRLDNSPLDAAMEFWLSGMQWLDVTDDPTCVEQRVADVVQQLTQTTD